MASAVAVAPACKATAEAQVLAQAVLRLWQLVRSQAAVAGCWNSRCPDLHTTACVLPSHLLPTGMHACMHQARHHLYIRHHQHKIG